MDSFLPQSFREILGALALIVAILFSFISIAKASREHCLRATGLFLLAGIILFANDAWAYFASVFIFGTAITQLEFLQNLAAIIRGSKEYFDYQKEFLSQSEIEKTIEKDVRESEVEALKEKAPEDKEFKISISPSNLSPGQFGLIVEEYAFKFLERRYEKPIERHVRLHGKTFMAEFDGIMQDHGVSRVFEIKTTRSGIYPRRILVDHVKTMAQGVARYKEATKKNAILNVVLIGDFSENFNRRLREYKEEVKSDESGVEIVFETFTFEDIGVEEILKASNNRFQPTQKPRG